MAVGIVAASEAKVLRRVGDLLKFKRPKPSVKRKGKSLCQHGHHPGTAAEKTPFDVKQGCLVTRYICGRCGISKFSTR